MGTETPEEQKMAPVRRRWRDQIRADMDPELWVFYTRTVPVLVGVLVLSYLASWLWPAY